MQGDAFLAEAFEVDPWSSEFFQIVSSIGQRIVALSSILDNLNGNPVVIRGAQDHLFQINQAFHLNSFTRPWIGTGQKFVGPEHSSPIRMLSMAMPAEYRYPKLTGEEALELIQLVDQLLEWLKEHQLNERDFIRESLIEGLENFLFRLNKLHWFGWGYSIESLRDVILAYVTLERGLDEAANPDASALLRKTASTLQKIFAYAGVVKEAFETSDWLIGAARIVLKTGTGPAVGYVAGFLTSID